MFVVFHAKEKKGLPVEFDFYLQEKCPSGERRKDSIEKWESYSSLIDGVPPSGAFDMPEELWLITKKKNLDFDFYAWKQEWKIVSVPFFELMGLDGLPDLHYNISRLNIVSPTGEEIAKKDYLILRFHSFDDELIDFDVKDAVKSKAIKNRFLYRTINLNSAVTTSRGIFVVREFCYTKTILISEKMARTFTEKKFSGFEIYEDKDFPRIYDDALTW